MYWFNSLAWVMYVLANRDLTCHTMRRLSAFSKRQQTGYDTRKCNQWHSIFLVWYWSRNSCWNVVWRSVFQTKCNRRWQ